jgi:enoyl-[acyl-carrier-protein] reductase (NADH)
VADTVVYLASEEADAITGADINVNSGVVMY